MQQPEKIQDEVRKVRRAFDALPPGDRAVIRRCRSADEVLLEGTFWRLTESAPPEIRSRLADVVVLFPTAKQSRLGASRFRLGTHLRRLVSAKSSVRIQDSIRFRQLIQADDRAELIHRLRRLLVHVDAPVDWGVIGQDILYWNDATRRRWSQDFFAPVKETSND